MSLRNYLNKIKPQFEEGGKLHSFKSLYDGFDTFLYVPNTTSKSGVNIHDAIDSKRIMSIVVIPSRARRLKIATTTLLTILLDSLSAPFLL